MAPRRRVATPRKKAAKKTKSFRRKRCTCVMCFVVPCTCVMCFVVPSRKIAVNVKKVSKASANSSEPCSCVMHFVMPTSEVLAQDNAVTNGEQIGDPEVIMDEVPPPEVLAQENPVSNGQQNGDSESRMDASTAYEDNNELDEVASNMDANDVASEIVKDQVVPEADEEVDSELDEEEVNCEVVGEVDSEAVEDEDDSDMDEDTSPSESSESESDTGSVMSGRSGERIQSLLWRWGYLDLSINQRLKLIRLTQAIEERDVLEEKIKRQLEEFSKIVETINAPASP